MIETKFDQIISITVPMTPLQKGILFHALHQENSANYINQAEINLPEAICKKHLDESIRQIIDRHDILRASISIEKFEFNIHKHAQCMIDFNDLSNLSSTDQKQKFNCLSEKRE